MTPAAQIIEARGARAARIRHVSLAGSGNVRGCGPMTGFAMNPGFGGFEVGIEAAGGVAFETTIDAGLRVAHLIKEPGGLGKIGGLQL